MSRPFALPLVNLPLIRISCISPSRYLNFKQCALREAWSSSRQEPPLLKSPTAILGTIIHKVFQAVVDGTVEHETELDKFWDSVEFEQTTRLSASPIYMHYVPLKTTVPFYAVKKAQCMIRAKKILFDGGELSGLHGRAAAELWMKSSDGKVAGAVDYVRPTPEGDVIVDYKTGRIVDENSPFNALKEEYVTQLKLYAALYYETKGKWPCKLELQDLNGKTFEVAFSKDQCLELIFEARKIFDEVNLLIENSEKTKAEQQLAQPSAKGCCYCAYKPGCLKYLQSDIAFRDGDVGLVDIRGDFVESKVADNGTHLVRLRSDDGALMAVRGLNLVRHPGLESVRSGQSVVIFSLLKDQVVNRYCESLTTVVFIK